MNPYRFRTSKKEPSSFLLYGKGSIVFYRIEAINCALDCSNLCVFWSIPVFWHCFHRISTVYTELHFWCFGAFPGDACFRPPPPGPDPLAVVNCLSGRGACRCYFWRIRGFTKLDIQAIDGRVLTQPRYLSLLFTRYEMRQGC